MEALCLKVVFCFFFLYASNTFFLTSSAATRLPTLGNETDHLALLAFKDGISEDPKLIMNSWNDSVHFCNWFGVTCSRRHPQRVTALNLSSQGLVGFLAPHIGNLSFLKNISLSTNSFQGQIPQEIGRLFRLVWLDLSNNSFNGNIPKNLTNCLELQVVTFYNNKLVGGISSELGSLSKLEWLNLGKNNLAGHIPPSLGNISSFAQLNLGWNSLDGSIPEELGQLARLGFLSVGENNLVGLIPSSIYNLSSLSVLAVVGNRLHGTLPPELGLALPNLEGLYLASNQFQGHIPRSLVNASKLVSVDLCGNNFTGSVPKEVGRLWLLRWFGLCSNQLGGTKDDDLDFVTSLTNCTDLYMLTLCKNQFSGQLPYSIANLSTQLQQLWLNGNQIFGTIPLGIENLASLNFLSMSENHITGTIPYHLGKLQKLEAIYLHQNRLSGKIPASIGNLTRLFALYISDNKLRGTIPWGLGNCHHLQHMWLHNNRFHGSIPKQLFTSPSLITLGLSNNAFSNSLPTEIGTLQNLEGVYVHDNKLSGEIPSTLGNCIKLQYLYMRGNFFEGVIPPSFSALKGLQALDLSHNNLSGLIPNYLEQLHFLQYLNLSFNDFEGEVPKHGIFQNTSAISVIGNIKLCGGVPKLHLPTCPIPTFRKQGRVVSLKVIVTIVISIVFCLSLLSYFIITHCRQKSCKKPLSSSFAKNSLWKITYEELLRSTNQFSSSNLIGVGSYGSVYKGIIDRIETIIVAVKVLNLQQPRSSKSFITECQVLRSVKHRNIVKILTVCSSVDFNGNDFKALVFEYMPNGSLDLWLHHPLRNLDILQRIKIAADVACALDYLHHHCQVPIIHCDLKPSNVLLDDDMVAHVSDFGLATMLSEGVVNHSHAQSSSLLIKGSIGYVAPEYNMGGNVSIYGDIYSYGILLLEMFIGKKPTDEMFKDNLSLPQLVKMAFPDRVMEIIDHRLLSEEIQIIRHCEDHDDITNRIQNCLVSLVRIGISCSTESPKERMGMKDVLREMHKVKDIYLGVEKYQAKHN